MDLTINDVADLLNMSEKTVQTLISKGQIPFYEIGKQVRFDRMEIEKWMLSDALHATAPELSADLVERGVMQGGTQQFSFYRALYRGDVLHDLEGTSKEEVIQNAMKQVAPLLGLDADVLSELLMDREKLMTTALNRGIAIPHPRDLVLKGPIDRIVVGFPKTPLDWDALDGSPVHVLFFLFSSADKRHLHLLAKIAHLASSPEALEFLHTKPSKEVLLGYVREWEMHIRI